MFHVSLDGDLQLLIRKVRPSDREHLRAGFDHLSERSRFFRFLGGVTRLSEPDLARFTAGSSDARCALGALDTGHEPPRPVAIARYERFDDDHASAEMAVTVIDAYQGRGVGSLLIGAVAACATRGGIERLVAYVHPENAGMIRLLEALGARLEHASEDERVFNLPVHRDPARYPDTASGKMVRRGYASMLAAGAASGRPPSRLGETEERQDCDDDDDKSDDVDDAVHGCSPSSVGRTTRPSVGSIRKR